MNILVEHLNRVPPPTLFHYTSSESLYNILSSESMWSTHVQFLNDSQEFHHGLAMIKARLETRLKEENGFEAGIILEDVWKRLESISPHAYVISFSEVGDSLPQWRGYCPKGGYNIAVNASILASRAESQNFRLVKCLYEREDQDRLVNAFVDNLTSHFDSWGTSEQHKDWLLSGRYFQSPAHFAESFGAEWIKAIASSIKNPFFAGEAEWRLVMDNPGEQTFVKPRGTLLIPHSKLALNHGPVASTATELGIVRGVTIGPQALPELAALGIEIFAEERKWKNFTYCITEVPYRPL